MNQPQERKRIVIPGAFLGLALVLGVLVILLNSDKMIIVGSQSQFSAQKEQEIAVSSIEAPAQNSPPLGARSPSVHSSVDTPNRGALRSTIRIVEEGSGVGISGACLALPGLPYRTLDRSEAEIVGISNDVGAVDLECTAPKQLHVLAAGYIGQTVLAVPGSTKEVCLKRGNTLAVVCCVDETPIARCMVVASQRELPPVSLSTERRLRNSVPGPYDSAVLTAETDSQGVAYIEGVLDADYYVDVYAYGYAVESSYPDGKVSAGGASLMTFQLEPILAAVPCINGDEVITYNINTSRLGTRSTLEGRYLRATRHRLQSQFPSALDVVVLLARDLETNLARDASGSFQPQTRLILLGRRTGLHDIELKPIPVLELTGPQVIDIANAGDSELRSEGLFVRILDATGEAINGLLDGVFSIDTGQLKIPIKAGANELPRGSYNLECSKPRLASFDPQIVTVPGAVDIRLSMPVQRVRLRVIDREGVEYYRYRYALGNHDRNSLHFTYDATDRDFILPCGGASLAVNVRGFAAFNGTFHIAKQSTVQLLECIMDVP
jgi:hypothetical protein